MVALAEVDAGSVMVENVLAESSVYVTNAVSSPFGP